jgi:hypothetical protein
MKVSKDEIVYRYFGIEFRIIFYLAALFFLLLSIVILKSFSPLSLLSFLIFLLVTLLTYFDSTRHLLTMEENELGLKRFFSRGSLKEIRINWDRIDNITTREYGIFKLLKTTQINSPVKEKIRVFSFMEDYYHFLKDLCERSKNAKIDKFTQDLLTGQADF